MLVNPYSSLITGTSASSVQKANSRLNNTIAQLVSGSSADAPSGDIAALSSAVGLQNQLASLRQVSINLAQSSSLVETADAGAEHIQNALGRLKEIATQANNGALNDSARNALNEEFKNLLADIQNTAANTQFGGRHLLDGSLTGSNALSFGSALSGSAGNNAGEQLSVEALTTDDVLGAAPIDVLSAANASEALSRIDQGLAKITSVRSSLGAFKSDLEYADAAISSAIFNQDAARSVLQDTDIAAASTEYAKNLLLQDASTAVTAQTLRLPPSYVELIK